MAKTNGLLLNGSLKTSGVTFYQRSGQTIIRAAHSEERRSNSRGQFVQRQRMRHTVALWQMIKPCQPMFCGGKSVYARFATLANRLPAVYVPSRGPLNTASFLMPDIPVSDGNLPPVRQWLGEVDGTAALLTSLKADELQKDDKLLLYTAEQVAEGKTPRALFDVREVAASEFATVDGHLALKGEQFADTMTGWALVLTRNGRCSSQNIVTRCTFYMQYTTEAALQHAAESYGGITNA